MVPLEAVIVTVCGVVKLPVNGEILGVLCACAGGRNTKKIVSKAIAKDQTHKLGLNAGDLLSLEAKHLMVREKELGTGRSTCCRLLLMVNMPLSP